MTLVDPDWHAARAAAHGSGRRLPDEQVPLAYALHRRTGADVRALTPLPPHAASDSFDLCRVTTVTDSNTYTDSNDNYTRAHAHDYYTDADTDTDTDADTDTDTDTDIYCTGVCCMSR